MTIRRRWHIAALAAAALIVAGCGGGTTDSPLASRVVVFGDSLSDVGTYTPATSIPRALGLATGGAPYFAGKFTTNTFTEYTLPPAGSTRSSNTNTANIWVEWIAARVGVPITPAMAGFGPDTPQTRVACPAAATSPALAGSCTGYAQGGARVTNPAGVNNPNGTGLVGTNPTLITLPVVTQVANHLASFGGFDGSEIVLVWAGANDGLLAFQAVGAGQIAPATAVANVQTAATELVALVKDQIAAKGATRIAVLNFPDPLLLPLGARQSDAGKALLTQILTTWNDTLSTGLAGTPGVALIDMRPLFVDVAANVAANPASNKYGIAKFAVNGIDDFACDPAKMAPATGGSAMFCNASPASAFVAPVPNLNSIRTGASASTWFYADDVHPTIGGHKVIADYVWGKIKDLGWVPSNL